jgi:plastocyanin
MTPTPTSAGSQAPLVFSGSAAIEIGDQFFLPSQITVTVGTTVTWINHGQLLHTATARDNSFNSSNLEFGGTYKFTFTKAGRVPYYCMNHSDMFGEVIVVDAR